MTYRNLLPLPDHLLQQIFLYDSTYKDIYDVVMDEIRLRVRLQIARDEFLEQQELELSIFELNASLYIADALGEDITLG